MNYNNIMQTKDVMANIFTCLFVIVCKFMLSIAFSKLQQLNAQ